MQILKLTIFLGLIAFSTAGGTFEFYGDDDTCTTPSNVGTDCTTALSTIEAMAGVDGSPFKDVKGACDAAVPSISAGGSCKSSGCSKNGMPLITTDGYYKISCSANAVFSSALIVAVAVVANTLF